VDKIVDKQGCCRFTQYPWAPGTAFRGRHRRNGSREKHRLGGRVGAHRARNGLHRL